MPPTESQHSGLDAEIDAQLAQLEQPAAVRTWQADDAGSRPGALHSMAAGAAAATTEATSLVRRRCQQDTQREQSQEVQQRAGQELTCLLEQCANHEARRLPALQLTGLAQRLSAASQQQQQQQQQQQASGPPGFRLWQPAADSVAGDNSAIGRPEPPVQHNSATVAQVARDCAASRSNLHMTG